MRFVRGKEVVEIPKYSDEAYSCCVGTRLMGCNNSHKAIRNGELFEVTDISLTTITLRNERGEISLTPQQLAKHCRLCWAVTYPSIQGRTLDGTVSVWDLDSKHFTARHLYVGVSRATHGSKVRVH